MDVKKEYDALATCLRLVGGDGFWQALTVLLREFVPFDDLVAISYPAQSLPFCVYHTLGPVRHSVLISDYLAGPYLLDPFYTVMRQGEREGTIGLSEVAPDKFRSTEYYERHYSRTGIVDEVGLSVRSQYGTCNLVSALRTGKSKPFSRSEIKQFHNRSAVLVNVAGKHLQTANPPIDNRNAKRWTFSETFGGDKLNLSPREVGISELILRGHSSLSISLILGIVEGTVKIHRKNIYRKLGISSQAQLFSFFLSRILDRVD